MRELVSLLIDRLCGGGGWLIALLLIAQVIIVALRYVFSLGLSWATDLMVSLFLLSVLLPGLMVIIGNARAGTREILWLTFRPEGSGPKGPWRPNNGDA